MEQTKHESGWADLLAAGRLPRFALICLGVWMNAADSLVTATIMPSVGADLGGYAFFGWAVAGFMVGGILASASAGRLSEMFGLRAATSLAGLLFALGCVLSAAAPSIDVFLLGRLIQGVGSGWISGFAMVAIAWLFPERHLARVFASVSAVWGIATVLGPLFGGVFAQAGNWRMVFWVFAAQALLFAVASPWLLQGRETSRSANATGIPWLQLALVGLSVGAVALADVIAVPEIALALVVAGLGGLVLALRIDAKARLRLLPHRAGDLRSVCGSAYLALFALTAASMGLSVYGPAILQQLHGLSPLWAGYVVGVEALAWTLAAFLVADARGDEERRWIRCGAVCVLAGIVGLMLVMRAAPLGWIILAAAVMGAGFGFSSSLTNRRVMAALSDEDRAIGSSALIAVRQTGGATGAAIAGATANLVGFNAGLTDATASAIAVWVFATALPLGLAGVWASWRLTGSAR